MADLRNMLGSLTATGYVAEAIKKVATTPSPDTINMTYYGHDGKLVGCYTGSSFTAAHDMHIMTAALELACRSRRNSSTSI